MCKMQQENKAKGNLKRQGFTPGSKYELMEQGFHGHAATFLTLDGKGRARVLVMLLNKEHEVRILVSSLGLQLT